MRKPLYTVWMVPQPHGFKVYLTDRPYIAWQKGVPQVVSKLILNCWDKFCPKIKYMLLSPLIHLENVFQKFKTLCFPASGDIQVVPYCLGIEGPLYLSTGGKGRQCLECCSELKNVQPHSSLSFQTGVRSVTDILALDNWNGCWWHSQNAETLYGRGTPWSQTFNTVL